MTGAQRGFLLLSSCLGDPNRRPLSAAQMRTLADRSWKLEDSALQGDLTVSHLLSLGYGQQMAQRILNLLSQEDVLDYYLTKAARQGCTALTRLHEEYPDVLRRSLGFEGPGVLWAKGDIRILDMPKIALVGSRDIKPANSAFARQVGLQAARQGYALVSGNARGADRLAQAACLENGGAVIAVVADGLTDKPYADRVLYLSEEDYDGAFSAQRALSRNRVIHALGEKTFVAQCDYETGGTWDGTVKNLRFGWSPVYCFRDGSAAMEQLFQMGAHRADGYLLEQLDRTFEKCPNFFDP